MGNCLTNISCLDKTVNLANENFSRRSLSPISGGVPEPLALQSNLENLRLKYFKGRNSIEIKEIPLFERPVLRRALSIQTSNESITPQLSPSVLNRQLSLKRSLTRSSTGAKSSFLKKAKEKLKRSTFKENLAEIYREESVSEESTGITPVLAGDGLLEKWKDEHSFIDRAKGDNEPINFCLD
ncbi:hypothetical protein SteCoe_4671 [Stentor coeruleus]|uniref:Uncharacterized protein n=1 Tax=Stentor coeruleus TaxID=5963 RepID=A0A1R2CU35_9CILI|nr:hypothetical protein SteCoe_4671 [Stentor coeruleus]